MKEWQKLTFQEIEIWMFVKDGKGNRGVVIDKSDGALYVKFEGQELADVLFSYEIESCLFSHSSAKMKTKVLSKDDIYEMLLSDPSLLNVSLKAVRKIEKAVLRKLNEDK